MTRNRAWFALAIFLSIAHYASFEIANTPLVTDIRLYVYFAAQKAAGAVPYRDFFDIKTPMATFVGAFLIHVGRVCSVDPLMSIRIGYLAVAAAVPVLYFVVFRQVEEDDPVPAFLAVGAFCCFPLLGFMPSVGNIPKLMMALFAVVAAILVGRRRWVLAGGAGILAFLDWQIGILVLGAVLAGALASGGHRLRSAVRVVFGAASCIAPFVFYFWMHDAFGDAIRQSVYSAYARGGSASPDILGGLLHIWDVVEQGCGGHEWLVVVAMLGFFVFPVWICRSAGNESFGQLISLGFYHYGVVAYSVFDFQLFGDLFILLHSIAFFLGIAFIEVYRTIRNAYLRIKNTHSWRGRADGIPAVLMCILVLAAARPSFLRSEFFLRSADNPKNATLDDQREVTAALRTHIVDKRLAFIQFVEQLFLSGRHNDMRYVTWGLGDYHHARLSADENRTDAWYRLLRETCPEVVALSGKVREEREFLEYFDQVELVSANGAYRVEVFILKDSVAAGRYLAEYCAAIEGGVQNRRPKEP